MPKHLNAKKVFLYFTHHFDTKLITVCKISISYLAIKYVPFIRVCYAHQFDT